jgi:hypothetical protein
MKRLLIGAAMIGTIAGQLAAQASFSGYVVTGPFGAVMLVPRTSNPNWWGQSPCGRGPGRHGDHLFPDWGYACDPLYADTSDDNASAPIATAVRQVVAPPQPASPPPPPAPIRSEMRDYHWPSSDSNSSTTPFLIVSKDGRVQSAMVVWVQDNTLHYIKPEGGKGRMPIDSIDRRATRQRNGKQANFWLPPEDGTEDALAIFPSSSIIDSSRAR